MSNIENRKEILFLYDIENANPNGDPNDENRPRVDVETGINIVTDVRLKRTIRDYMKEIKGYEIFVREIANEDGHIQDAKSRAKDFLKEGDAEKPFIKQKESIDDSVCSECIDVRLFGATIPLELTVPGKKGKKRAGLKEELNIQGQYSLRWGNLFIL